MCPTPFSLFEGLRFLSNLLANELNHSIVYLELFFSSVSWKFIAFRWQSWWKQMRISPASTSLSESCKFFSVSQKMKSSRELRWLEYHSTCQDIALKKLQVCLMQWLNQVVHLKRCEFLELLNRFLKRSLTSFPS